MRKAKTLEDIQNPPQPGPMTSRAQEILDEMEGHPSTDSYFLPLRKNMVMLRTPRNTGDISTAQRGIGEFVTRIVEWQKAMKETPEASGVTEPYIRALSVRDLDIEDLCNAYALHYWSHPDEIGGRFTETDCLMMVAYDCYNISKLVSKIEDVLSRGTMMFAFGGVAEKKAS